MDGQSYPKLHTKKNISITATILNFLLGYITYHSTLDGKPVTLNEWVLLMIIVNIIFIAPICLIILLYCKIKNKAIERAEAKAQNESSKVYFSNDSLKQDISLDTSVPKQPIPVKETASASKSLPSSSFEQEQISISLTPIVDVEPQIKSSTSVNSAHQELLKKYAIITPLDTTDFTDFDFFVESGMLCIEHFSDPDKIKLLQRHLRIGFNRAIRLCDQLVYHKVLSSKGLHYDVIMDRDSFYALITTFHGRMPEASTSEEFDCTIDDDKLLTPSNMSGPEFEERCAELLRKNGFINVIVTKKSGDHGADVLAEKDGISYAIQCKYYSSTVGNSAVQEAFYAKAFYGKDIAVVMTNSYFTRPAQEEAAKIHVKLWDKDKLQTLLKNSQSTGNSQ